MDPTELQNMKINFKRAQDMAGKAAEARDSESWLKANYYISFAIYKQNEMILNEILKEKK